MNARPLMFVPGPRGGRSLELLAHVPLFRGFTPGELARVAEGTTQVRADRGQVLFHRGDASTGFHIVAYGQVKLAVANEAGEEKVLDILGPGRTFGEAVMFSGNAYPVTATALADSLLLHVASSVVFALVDAEPRLARRMLAGLSQRLHALVKDVEALTLHSAAQRVIGYFSRLEEEGGNPGVVTLPAQKSLIASHLNLTPEYFSRILHDLQAEGLVRVEGREIHVLDPARLRSFTP